MQEDGSDLPADLSLDQKIRNLLDVSFMLWYKRSCSSEGSFLLNATETAG